MAEMTDEELDNALLDRRLEKARARAASKPMETPQTGINWDTMGKNVKSLVGGTGIGEQLPIIGEPIRKAGSAVGSAVGAGIESLFSDQSYGDLYKQRQDRAEAEHQKDIAIDKAGPFGALVKTAGAGLAVPMPKAGMTERYIPEMASKAGQFGKWLAGTGERAAYQGGISGADTMSRGGNAEEALESAKYGALFSGGFDVAPQIAKGIGHGYSRGMAGIRPEVLDYYRANRSRVNAANPIQAADTLGEAAGGLRNRAEGLKEDVKAEVSSLASQGKGEAIKREAAAKEVVGEAKAKGLGEADEMQRGVAEDLSVSQKGARKAVNEAALEAMAIAEQSGAMIKLAPFKGSLTSRLKEFDVGQTRMGGGVAVLEKLRDRLDEIGEKEISAIEFRRLIKSLDDDIEEIIGTTAKAGYITPGQRELTGVRRGWKEKMETEVPGYAEAQAKTAGKTRALKGLQENFDYDPDAVYRQLKGINEPGKRSQLESLKNYEGEFGGDYSQRMGEAQGKRTADYEALGRPEMERAAEMRGEKYRDYFKDQIDEARRLKGVAGNINEENALQHLKQYGTNPEMRYMKGRRLEEIAREQNKPVVGGMSQASLPAPENQFTQSALDLANQRNMSSSFTRGSRNVNLGAMSVAGVGNMLGAGMERLPGLATAGAILGGVSDIMGPTIVRRMSDIIDSPRGQRFAQIYREAAKRGPQAIAMTHAMLMKKDPEYQAMMDENFKKKMSEGGDPSARSEPEAGLESEGFFDVVKPYKQALLKKSGMPEWAQDTADFLLPDDVMGLADIAKLGRKGGSAVSKVYENAIQKSPRNISIAGKPLGSRAVKVGDEVYSHKIFMRNGKVQHVLVNAGGEPVAEIQGNVMNYNGEKGFAIDWSHSNTTGKGDGRRLYDLVLDSHSKIFSDTSLSPEGSHKVYADHFTKKPGVGVDLADWETPNRHVVTLNDSKAFKKSLGAKVVPKKTREYLDKFDPEVDEVVESSANRAARRTSAEDREYKESMARWERSIARGGNLNNIRRNININVPERFRSAALARIDQAEKDIANGRFLPEFLTAPIEKVDTSDLIKAAEGIIFGNSPRIQKVSREGILSLMNESPKHKEEFMEWANDRIADGLDDDGFWRSVLKRGGVDNSQIQNSVRKSLGLTEANIEDLEFAKTVSRSRFLNDAKQIAQMTIANSNRYWSDDKQKQLLQQIIRSFE
jgi:hypothetical protein